MIITKLPKPFAACANSADEIDCFIHLATDERSEDILKLMELTWPAADAPPLLFVGKQTAMRLQQGLPYPIVYKKSYDVKGAPK
jgi:hypothetical protein